jgi:hypothetical protein
VTERERGRDGEKERGREGEIEVGLALRAGLFLKHFPDMSGAGSEPALTQPSPIQVSRGAAEPRRRGARPDTLVSVLLGPLALVE